MKAPVLISAPLVSALLVILSVAFAPSSYAARGQAAPQPPLAQSTASQKSEHHASLADMAAAGDADAQYQMGEQSLNQKKANAKTTRQALVWFMLAGRNGNVQGAIAAAKLLETTGEIHNASRWWYRAGQLGDGASRKRFIDLFLDGQTWGVEGKDGITWLAEWALTSHNSSVKLALGNAFESGLGVVPNSAEAQHWYADAALDRNLEAMRRLGVLDLHAPSRWRITDKETDADGHWTGPYLQPLRPLDKDDSGVLDNGRSTIAQAENVSPDHLTFARPEMVDGQFWLTQAARSGLPAAKTALGLAKLDGLSLPLDLPGGLWRLASAACAGDPAAASALSQYWRDRNPLRAWVFLEVAAKSGRTVKQDEWSSLESALNTRQIARAKQIAQDWCPQN